MKHLLVALFSFLIITLSYADDIELISTVSIAPRGNNPITYEFHADTKRLKKYFTSDLVVPRLSVTPHIAASRAKRAVEEAYGITLQNMFTQTVSHARVRRLANTYVWYYCFIPQWINSEGCSQEVPVLVLPNGKVLFPERK